MTAYYVAASNRYFWQTLGVQATSAEAAAEAFRAYLAAPAQQTAQAYELEQAEQFGSDGSEGELDRASYVYDFDDGIIEECDEPDAPKVGEAVRMLDSGGKG
jgi:hypothetical protein